MRANGYEGIYLAISEHVSENWDLVSNLKKLLQKFSLILYQKTSNRLYLRSVYILTPKHWSEPQGKLADAVSYNGRVNGVNMENTPIRLYKGRARTFP